MHNGQLIFLEERRERRKAWVQAEKSVKIDCRIVSATPRLGNCDAGAQTIVVGFGEGHHNVQAVGGSALEEHNELLLPCPGCRSNRALQKSRNGARPTMAMPPCFIK